MQQMSKRYQTSKGCETARKKGTFKTKRQNLHWYIKNITNSINKIIVCVCVCVSLSI